MADSEMINSSEQGGLREINEKKANLAAILSLMHRRIKLLDESSKELDETLRIAYTLCPPSEVAAAAAARALEEQQQQQQQQQQNLELTSPISPARTSSPTAGQRTSKRTTRKSSTSLKSAAAAAASTGASAGKQPPIISNSSTARGTKVSKINCAELLNYAQRVSRHTLAFEPPIPQELEMRMSALLKDELEGGGMGLPDTGLPAAEGTAKEDEILNDHHQALKPDDTAMEEEEVHDEEALLDLF